MNTLGGGLLVDLNGDDPCLVHLPYFYPSPNRSSGALWQ